MEITAIVRVFGRKSKQITRCERGQAKPVKKRTCGNNGNGFLNHEFKPVWGFEGNRERLEKEFNNSLANLCRYYKLKIPKTDFPFPQNIYYRWQQVANKVTAIDKNYHCMITADRGKRAVLSVVKTFDMNGLHYISVRAYWRWAQCAEQQAIADLLTVIFAYLHQVVAIPFYAENNSFMNYQYDTIEQWIYELEDEGMNDEENKAWKQEQEDTMYELKQAGCHILRLIQDPGQLARMEQVVMEYKHRDSSELEFALIGIEFLQLYIQYPKRTVADNIKTDLVYPEETDRITIDQSTGFYWSSKDCFADELDDMIDSTFQEISVMDEPISVQLFDKMPLNDNTDFDFETRLFGLMDRLRELLKDYDHEKYHPAV